MHRWGASVFIILLFLHMGRVFLFGAYKYPRELNWLIGVLLLALGMFEGFTGYLLPWDQTAYWATVVGININGTGPFVGPFLSNILRGGSEIGTDTLARFYAIHMLLIPGGLIALIGLHLYLVVRLGVTSPPWSKTPPVVSGRPRSTRASRASSSRGRAGTRATSRPERRRRGGVSRGRPQEAEGRAPRRVRALQGGRQEAREAVLPVRDVPRHDHVARRRRRDHRASRASGTSRPARRRATRGSSGRATRTKADPETIAFVPRPDWYFYFLFYLLRIFKWPESVVLGTVGIPTIALILLLAVPFIDRRRERRLLAPPGRRDRRRPRDRLDGRADLEGRDGEGGPRRRRRRPGRPRGSQDDNLPEEARPGRAPLRGLAAASSCHIYLGAGSQNLGAPELTKRASATAASSGRSST